jgi:hypothetical protein
MKSTNWIEFFGKHWICDVCRKTMGSGTGYICGSAVLCLKHYQDKFPKFKQEEHKEYQQGLLKTNEN